MKNCKDCKWWAESDDWACRMRDKETHRRCMAIVPEEDLATEKSQAIAYGIGYDASGSLITRYDFGCVQFDPKA